MSCTERRVDLGPRRLTLSVCSWNASSSGTPLVILHGFLEQGAAWDQVARALPMPCHAPDQRGHGRSEHVGVGGFYHFWDYVADLDALLEHLSPDAPVDLLGHSMGGTVSSYYAGSRPERVRRLVLVEGLGPPDTEDNAVGRARQFLRQFRSPRTHGADFPDVAAAAARMRRHNPGLSEPIALQLAERQLVHTNHGYRWRWDELHRHTSPFPFVARIFVKFLEAIEAPTLVAYGGDSPFPGIERSTHLRDATTVRIPDAGHLIHHDQPQALASHILDHLRGR